MALLGTNGAGKSTLLRAISGLVPVDDGLDRLRRRRHHRAGARTRWRPLGVVQMPGGAGVFPSLTVAENLRVAGWLHRGDAVGDRGRPTDVGELFPCSTSGPASRRATCPAASSRCWPWPWRS